MAPCGAGTPGRRSGRPIRLMWWWPVLSRGKVTPASVSYYTGEVAGGLEDYYAGRGESPGHWLGRGSASAGLSGEVSAGQLARLFTGEHPDTGNPLGSSYNVRRERTG